MMFFLALLYLHVLSLQVYAHGLVAEISIDGVVYQGYPAYDSASKPQRIVRAMYSNGPITDVSSAAIACNGQNEPAALVANATAGSVIIYTWGSWPIGHTGPISNYMASCGDTGCTSFNATNGSWFKIDQEGYSDGLWATDRLQKNKLQYAFMLPNNIPNGQYLLRHEILALHQTGAPQYYPSCAQINVVGGSGSLPSENLVTFPGAYNSSDAGYKFNIYSKSYATYPVEGPPILRSSLSSTSTPSPSNGTNTSPLTPPPAGRVCYLPPPGTKLRKRMIPRHGTNVPRFLKRMLGES